MSFDQNDIHSDGRKHPMLSRLRRRLTYANVVATLALVFAMSGGAYAAGRYLITTTGQIKPTVLAQLNGRRGRQGKAGKQGAAGPAGVKGETGPAGLKGETGSTGAKGQTGATGDTGETGPAGPEGKAGESVKITKLNGEAGGCKEGGVELSNKLGKGVACNGGAGDGSGGYTETLPEGKTERGYWSVSTAGATYFGPYSGIATISFPVPVKPVIEEENVVFVNPGETNAHCPKGNSAEAQAEPGYLCLYAIGSVEGMFNSGSVVTSPFGAYFRFQSTNAEGYASGSWAVTAEVK